MYVLVVDILVADVGTDAARTPPPFGLNVDCRSLHKIALWFFNVPFTRFLLLDHCVARVGNGCVFLAGYHCHRERDVLNTLHSLLGGDDYLLKRLPIGQRSL